MSATTKKVRVTVALLMATKLAIASLKVFAHFLTRKGQGKAVVISWRVDSVAIRRLGINRRIRRGRIMSRLVVGCHIHKILMAMSEQVEPREVIRTAPWRMILTLTISHQIQLSEKTQQKITPSSCFRGALT